MKLTLVAFSWKRSMVWTTLKVGFSGEFSEGLVWLPIRVTHPKGARGCCYIRYNHLRMGKPVWFSLSLDPHPTIWVLNLLDKSWMSMDTYSHALGELLAVEASSFGVAYGPL